MTAKNRSRRCGRPPWTGTGGSAPSRLRECGGILGGSDWETQTAALSLLSERLDGLIASARERAEKEGRMYRSLGLLSGLLLAILAL